MPIPFEVSYKLIGRKQRRERTVIGVMCPTPIAQYLGIAKPIFVEMGDVIVDWTTDTSDGYRAMFDLAAVR